MTADAEDGEVAALMRAMWAKYRTLTVARVAVLIQAMAALDVGPLTPELRDRAESEAHSLAGSLGTFGFQDGSRAARAIELQLRAPEADRTVLDASLQDLCDALARDPEVRIPGRPEPR